jgi:TonB family protein
VYVSKRSIPERSGAVTLTVSLTAVLLGGMVALSRIAAPVPAGDKALRVFDVSAGETVEAPEPAVEPAVEPAARPVERQAPAPVTAVSPPAIARAMATPEPLPMMPAVVTGEAMPTGLPASATSGAGRAAPAASAPGAARAVPAAGKATERPDDADQYGRTVFREIRARQSYPAELARAGLAGTVVVEFRVSSRGRVYAVVVVSSDHRLLDRLAMAQVQATPLPPPPRGEPRTFRIPMTYRMR